jgi:hypothetical protein
MKGNILEEVISLTPFIECLTWKERIAVHSTQKAFSALLDSDSRWTLFVEILSKQHLIYHTPFPSFTFKNTFLNFGLFVQSGARPLRIMSLMVLTLLLP